MNVKEKCIFTIAFIISLCPTTLKWFGLAGITEIKGTFIFHYPATLLFATLFLLIIWLNVRLIIKAVISALSLSGIIGAEVYSFFTWYIQVKSDKPSLSLSVRLTFPEYYAALIISITMLIYFIIHSAIIYKRLKHTAEA